MNNELIHHVDVVLNSNVYTVGSSLFAWAKNNIKDTNLITSLSIYCQRFVHRVLDLGKQSLRNFKLISFVMQELAMVVELAGNAFDKDMVYLSYMQTAPIFKILQVVP